MPVETKDEVSDSNDDNQPEFWGVATVIKPQKYVSPQSIYAQPLMTGTKRHDLDHIRRIEATLNHRESFDEAEIRS